MKNIPWKAFFMEFCELNFFYIILAFYKSLLYSKERCKKLIKSVVLD